MGAVAPFVIVARLGRIGAALPAAAVNGIVPVIVVAGGRAVPAPIPVHEGRMPPVNPRILAGDDDALPRVAQGPGVVGVDAHQVLLDARNGTAEGQDAGRRQPGLQFDAAHVRVGSDGRHVGPPRQLIEQVLAGPHPDGVDQVIRPVLGAARLQEGQQVALALRGRGA